MESHYRINLKFVVSFILFLFVMSGTMSQGYKYYKVNHPILWNQIHAEELDDGIVIRCAFSQRIDQNEYTSLLREYGTLKEFDYYVVPFLDENYLIAITDEDTKRMMESYTDENVIVDVVVRNNQGGILSEDALVNPDFVLVQLDKTKMKNRLTYWLIALFYSIYKLFKAKSLFIEINDGSAENYALMYSFTYNLPSELEREQYKLKNYQDLKKKMEGWTRYGLIMMVSGALGMISGFIITIIGGCILFLLGLEEVFQGFINSDFEFAKKFAKFFGFSSIQFQKEDCIARIYAIENEMKKRVNSVKRRYR